MTRNVRIKRGHKPPAVEKQERAIESAVKAEMQRHMDDMRRAVREEFVETMRPAFNDMMLGLDAVAVILADLRGITGIYADRRVSKELATFAAKLQTALNNVSVLRNLGDGFVTSGVATEVELCELSGLASDIERFDDLRYRLAHEDEDDLDDLDIPYYDPDLLGSDR